MKYFIGITPQGTVRVIHFRSMGGRVSGKQITQECGFLDVVTCTVLANKGFSINELVGIHQAEVKLPAFTKEKTQLSAKRSAKLQELRIHVERLIGAIRTKNFSNNIKADGAEVSVADKLMTIIMLCIS